MSSEKIITPIVAIVDGSVLIFHSVRAAERYIEVADVDLYKVYDALCRKLEISIVKLEYKVIFGKKWMVDGVKLTLSSTTQEPEYVMGKLIQFVTYHGYDQEEVKNLPISLMLEIIDWILHGKKGMKFYCSRFT